jgi:tRNA A-37 threonylcarbamoyl transferase component Bud32
MVPQAPAPGNGPLPQSVAVRAPHCRGAAVASAATALQPLFAALPRGGGLVPVKQSTVRTVLRGRIGDLDVHVKLYRQGTLSARARDALRGDRAEREAGNLLAASRLGLPAVEPLAHGSCDGDDGPQGFLVTRTVPGARRFAFDLPPAVLRAVGALLRTAHDRGFLPGDLHPGNLVVDGEGAPWLLDLSSVRHSGDADLGRRAAALAFFCQELDGGPLDPRAAPLLAGYREAGAPLAAPFAARLAQAARAVRTRALAAFGRRSSRDCRHTVLGQRRRGTPRWHFHRTGDEAADARLREACTAFLAAPPLPQRTGRRGSVWLLDGLVVKQREQGTARKLFAAMYWLLCAGVPQAAPVALCTFDGTGHVFTARLPSANLADELRARKFAAGEATATARALGLAVGRLHAHGMRNRDLKLDNLVRDPATGRICMVDVDGVRRKRPSDTRGQGADLGRLLAAWRAAGAPGGAAAFAAFVRAYQRARQRLLQAAPLRRLRRAADKRAREWLSAHR